MNDHDFEEKLLALTGAAGRPDPTPAWKAEILGRALRAAEAAPLTRLTPPRWLMLSWAAAWTAILVLSLATPRKTMTAARQRIAAAPASSQSPDAPGAYPATQTLFAFHQHMNPYLELP